MDWSDSLWFISIFYLSLHEDIIIQRCMAKIQRVTIPPKPPFGLHISKLTVSFSANESVHSLACSISKIFNITHTHTHTHIHTVQLEKLCSRDTMCTLFLDNVTLKVTFMFYLLHESIEVEPWIEWESSERERERERERARLLGCSPPLLTPFNTQHQLTLAPLATETHTQTHMHIAFYNHTSNPYTYNKNWINSSNPEACQYIKRPAACWTQFCT